MEHSFHSPLSHFDAAAVLEVLGVPLLVLDGDCCVTFANTAARRLLRLSTAEFQGRPFDHLFRDGGDLRRRLKSLLREPEPGRTVEMRVMQVSHPRRGLRAKVFAIDGAPTGPHLIVQIARPRRSRAARPPRRVLSLVASQPGQLECA